ncbi:unnamed protein product [Pieris brassicae]|uniref:Uncharacterized protein n=1 Tax=Pieris brassicae TaxID=7116 RepID=A0A9P0TEJ5_PIEBR|nr:unnamed protein product [Pieris brassicae]
MRSIRVCSPLYREIAGGWGGSEAASQGARAYPAVSRSPGLEIWNCVCVCELCELAVVARCEASVILCVQEGDWRHLQTAWLWRAADTMLAAEQQPAPT